RGPIPQPALEAGAGLGTLGASSTESPAQEPTPAQPLQEESEGSRSTEPLPRALETRGNAPDLDSPRTSSVQRAVAAPVSYWSESADEGNPLRGASRQPIGTGVAR